MLFGAARNSEWSAETVPERNIDPEAGRDIGSLPGLHLVAVPDELITRDLVIAYAKIGILLVPNSVAPKSN